MAGDWIKMELATPDKQEVLAIAGRMGWDDPDMAVGKLFRVWRWFDQQTIDGNATGVTLALLDRIAGVSGFGAAMQSVGWLAVTDAGIRLPNFDRHCGKTAKDRALTAKRVANHKANAKGNGTGNAAIVTEALPREEKRREEQRQTPAPKRVVVGFDQFWSAYPKKKAKADAERAFTKINPNEHLLGEILAAVQRATTSEDWRKSGGQFIPHPATWLNDQRWLDEADTPLASVKTSANLRVAGGFVA